MDLPSLLRALPQRFLGNRERERDLDDELRFHIEMQTEENVRLGMDPEEARRQAVLLFGGVEGHKEAIRAGRPLRVVEDTVADVRYASRILWKNRSFTGLAVLALAVGIGTTTAVYSVANWVLLRPIPGVRDADELVVVQWRRTESDDTGISATNLADLAAATPAFATLAGSAPGSYQLASEGSPSRLVEGEAVVGDWLGMLGVRPQRGRLFAPSEIDPTGSARVVVISDFLWRSYFAGAPDVLGRRLSLNGSEFQVIGVGPRGFRGVQRTGTHDLWLPISAYPLLRHRPEWSATDRTANYAMQIVGRLLPEATPELAELQLRRATESLVAAHPEAAGLYREYVPRVTPGVGVPVLGRDEIHQTIRLLAGIAAVVLLIASANVSNLILLRGVHRRGEMAVRRALGASGGRLLRQYLVEGLLLSLAAGAGGMMIAFALTGLVSGARVWWIGRAEEVGIDWRVFLFAFAVAVACGIVCAILPALDTRRHDFLAHLREAGRAETGRSGHLRAGLTVVQVGASMLLLVGALLLARSLQNLRSVELGYEPDRVLAVLVDPSPLGYDDARLRALRFELLDGLTGLPGTHATAVASTSPFGIQFFQRVLHPDALDAAPHEAATFYVSPEYFRALGIPFLAGRSFSVAETRAESEAAVDGPVVISRSLAFRLFGRADVLGERLITDGYRDDDHPHTIVGVVGDTRATDLRAAPDLVLYQPLAGAPEWTSPTLLAGLEGPRDEVERWVTAMVAEVDPALPVYRVATLSEQVASAMAEDRLLAQLVGLLSVVAVLLAATGLYGLIAYSVARRTREIGIRMALGAHASAVARLVSLHTVLLVGAGVVIGTGAALNLSRVLESRLFGVEALDPWVYLGAAAIFFVVAIVATSAPVRAATRVDPVEALRSE